MFELHIFSQLVKVDIERNTFVRRRRIINFTMRYKTIIRTSFQLQHLVVLYDAHALRLSEEVFISPFSASAQFCKSNGFWYACACRWLRRLDISHGSVRIKLAVVVISGGIKGKVNLVSSIFLSGWTYLGKQVVFVAVEQRWVISFKLFKYDLTF